MQKTMRRLNNATRPGTSKPINNAPEDKAFWNHDGMVFLNLKELAQGLNVMSDETYIYHANSDKNDYGIWVREVLEDPEAARRLESARDRKEAFRSIMV